VRLGLRLISGLAEAEAKTIVARRNTGYTSVSGVWTRSGASLATMERLAAADTFRSIGLDRRAALWEVRGLGVSTPDIGTTTKRGASAKSIRATAPLLDAPDYGDLFDEPKVALPGMAESEHVAEDYATTGLSLKAHPCKFFRDELSRQGVITSEAHRDERHRGRKVSVAGLVLVRQRPGTAKGVVFLTMEDETGIINVIVWPKVFEANRRLVMSSQFLLVRGRLEREGLVIHVVAEELVDLTQRLGELSEGETEMPPTARNPGEGSWRSKSRDFH
jgi:error-prone DNA polymerase